MIRRVAGNVIVTRRERLVGELPPFIVAVATSQTTKRREDRLICLVWGGLARNRWSGLLGNRFETLQTESHDESPRFR